MSNIRSCLIYFVAAELMLSSISGPGLAVQAGAATTTAITTDPRAFLDDLASRAFAVLRDHSVGEAKRRQAFRQMLHDNFALKEIGDRLIRHHRAEITPAQYAIYSQVFPGFVVGAYDDKLQGFANARFQTIRSMPRGTAGLVDVFARVTVPGKAPIDTVWTIRPTEGGHYLVTNLTVSGINLALTQEADFDSTIQRQGFDALIAFMRRQQAPAA